MKKTFAFLLLFVSLTFLPAVSFANEYGIVFYVGVGRDNSEEPGDPEEPGHPGRRTVPYPIYCEINFEEETISGPSILDHITDYEIWEESGESCFSVSYDGSSFVQTLKMLPTPGIYSIVLRGPDVVLSGYIQF